MECRTGIPAVVVLQAVAAPSSVRVTVVLVAEIACPTVSRAVGTDDRVAATCLTVLSTPDVSEALLLQTLPSTAGTLTAFLLRPSILVALCVTFPFDAVPLERVIVVLNGVLLDVCRAVANRPVSDPVAQGSLAKGLQVASPGACRAWVSAPTLL